jgi:hypothetical protein
MQIETGHPILILADSTSTSLLPTEIGTNFAAAAESSIVFAVLSFVDGATRVTITDEACISDGQKLFSGSINVPSGSVTLMDSNLFRYLNIPVQEDNLAIGIWADAPENPDWVWIQLETIRPI